MLSVVMRATKNEKRNCFLIINCNGFVVNKLLFSIGDIVGIEFIVGIGVIDYFSRRGRIRQSQINPDFSVNTR